MWVHRAMAESPGNLLKSKIPRSYLRPIESHCREKDPTICFNTAFRFFIYILKLEDHYSNPSVTKKSPWASYTGMTLDLISDAEELGSHPDLQVQKQYFNSLQ